MSAFTSVFNAVSSALMPTTQSRGQKLLGAIDDINDAVDAQDKAGRVQHALDLVAQGASLTETDAAGNTALMRAIFFGHAALEDALLKAGSDIHHKNNQGITPLSEAADRDDPAMLEALLKKGTRVNDQDNDGNTALHWAAARGSTDIVETLVQNSAGVNAPGSEGQTPLIKAVVTGGADPVIVRALIDAGADISVKDKHGHTAYDYAAGSGQFATHADAARLLREAQAKADAPKPEPPQPQALPDPPPAENPLVLQRNIKTMSLRFKRPLTT